MQFYITICGDTSGCDGTFCLSTLISGHISANQKKVWIRTKWKNNSEKCQNQNSTLFW